MSSWAGSHEGSSRCHMSVYSLFGGWEGSQLCLRALMQITKALQVMHENFLNSQIGFNESDLMQMTEL